MTDPHGDLPGRGRRVLVTGATGLIGGAVVQALLARGYAVTGVTLDADTVSAADRLLVGDAADEALIEDALDGVDAVVHLAAIPHPDLGTARSVFVGNTSATFTVLDAAGRRGVRRAVLASSINAFGVPLNRREILPAYYPLDELSPVAHDDAYSLSKWVDEQTAAWAGNRFGMTVIALRFPLVRALPELRERAGRMHEEPDAELRRLAREGWAYLEIDDAVDAIVLGVEAEVTGVHTVLVAAEDTLMSEPTETLLDRYAKASERRMRFVGFTAPVDTLAARRLLGWAPRRSIRGEQSRPELTEVVR